MAEYKPNSNKYKTEQRKKQEKVVQGKVRRKKKSEVRKWKDTFISKDAEDVKSYIIMDVIVPTIKNTILDVVSMCLFGDTVKRSKNHNTVSYNRCYPSASQSGRTNRRNATSSRYDFDDIIFDSRGEAEDVLDHMGEIMDAYNGVVTVADFYDLAGVTGTWTDNNYGWTNLSQATVQRTRDGFIINLPKAIPV